MELKVIASINKDLEIFKNDEKIFYSTIKYLWLRKIIEVFNAKDEKLIEIKYAGFFTETYKIISQSDILNLKIKSINDSEILLNDNSKIQKSRYSFGFKSRSAYMHKGEKIATSEENYWFWKRKFVIKIETIDSELLNILAMVILIYENGIIAGD